MLPEFSLACKNTRKTEANLFFYLYPQHTWLGRTLRHAVCISHTHLIVSFWLAEHRDQAQNCADQLFNANNMIPCWNEHWLALETTFVCNKWHLGKTRTYYTSTKNTQFCCSVTFSTMNFCYHWVVCSIQKFISFPFQRALFKYSHGILFDLAAQ